MSGDYSATGLADQLDPGPAAVAMPDASPGLTLVGPVWSEVVYERDAVADIGAEAVCWAIYGELWEYREGGFYVTALSQDRRRHLVETHAALRLARGVTTPRARARCAASPPSDTGGTPTHSPARVRSAN
jgi:hypothetical protein